MNTKALTVTPINIMIRSFRSCGGKQGKALRENDSIGPEYRAIVLWLLNRIKRTRLAPSSYWNLKRALVRTGCMASSDIDLTEGLKRSLELKPQVDLSASGDRDAPTVNLTDEQVQALRAESGAKARGGSEVRTATMSAEEFADMAKRSDALATKPRNTETVTVKEAIQGLVEHG
jgi:hypothetical protein